MNKVVIIEDVPEYSMTLEEDLKDLDVSISYFSSGRDFFRSLYHFETAVILLGLNDTDKSLEIAKAIRTYDQISLIILLTKDDSYEMETKSLEAQTDIFFKKSDSLGLLRAHITNHVRRIKAYKDLMDQSADTSDFSTLT